MRERGVGMKDKIQERSNNISKLNVASSEIKVSSITYVTDDTSIGQSSVNSYFTGDYEGFYEDDMEVDDVMFPTFLTSCETITLPRGVVREVSRLPKYLLKNIDTDISVAKEKCLLCASNLTPTLFWDKSDYWKSLSSTRLHKQLQTKRDNTYTYSKVLYALQHSTPKSPAIIESRKNQAGKESYQVNVASKQYRFASLYHDKGVVQYELKNQKLLDSRRRFYYNKLADAISNPIGSNLIKLYGRIELPSKDEIIKQGAFLAKNKYKTNKNKLLTRLNNKSKSSFEDVENRSFVEDNLKQFEYLTANGYFIPKIGSEKSGGRVVDSFNLMPSWIRKLCEIDGEKIVEMDYVALHPNICMTIFNGDKKFLTHENVAEQLEAERIEVKFEHLSFFNRHPKDMERSVLYSYYEEREPLMLGNLLADKRRFGYKNTSRLLFKYEVDILKACIIKLNKHNVFVMYVYDALYCKESDVDFVKEVMNEVVVAKGVYTTVK